MHQEHSLKHIITFNWIIFWKGFQISWYFFSKSINTLTVCNISRVKHDQDLKTQQKPTLTLLVPRWDLDHRFPSGRATATGSDPT